MKSDATIKSNVQQIVQSFFWCKHNQNFLRTDFSNRLHLFIYTCTNTHMCTHSCKCRSLCVCAHVFRHIILNRVLPFSCWTHTYLHPGLQILLVNSDNSFVQSWYLIPGCCTLKSSTNAHILKLYKQQFCEHKIIKLHLEDQNQASNTQSNYQRTDIYFLKQTCKVLQYYMTHLFIVILQICSQKLSFQNSWMLLYSLLAFIFK